MLRSSAPWGSLLRQEVEEIPRLPDMAPIFDQAEYASWRGFRFGGLRYGPDLPRFLLRLPYGQDTYPVKTFHFEEEAGGGASEISLGNASFALAATMARSFADNGWCGTFVARSRAPVKTCRSIIRSRRRDQHQDPTEV